MANVITVPGFGRREAKANRRTALLAAAARLFAERGFNGVSMEDLGASVGVSGPALYRHFDSKQAVLAALLVGVSQELFDGGLEHAERAPGGELALRSLIEFHVRFALDNPHVIRVQDRDLDSLTDEDRRRVRRLQRKYVEIWVDVLSTMFPSIETGVLRVRAHAMFGLINSTPHTVSGKAASLSRNDVRDILESMAFDAVCSGIR